MPSNSSTLRCFDLGLPGRVQVGDFPVAWTPKDRTFKPQLVQEWPASNRGSPLAMRPPVREIRFFLALS